jgi:tetratricopeptide (TPR) repeat protein
VGGEIDDQTCGKSDVLAPGELERAADTIQRLKDVTDEENRVMLAALRLEWALARDTQEDQPAKVKAAIDAIAAARRLLGDRGAEADAVRIAVDYWEAHVRLVEYDYLSARELFSTILTLDPGHQAANVWRIVCERMLGGDPVKLVERIDELMGVGSPVASGVSPEDGAVVVSPHLVGELLTERASLLENSEPALAERDYRRALDLRPQMTFAQHGVLRCLVASSQLELAASLGDRLIAEARAAHHDCGLPLPADVFVNVGLVEAERGRIDRAFELLGDAVESDPDYPVGHENLILTHLAVDQVGEAIRHGESVLSPSLGREKAWNGVRVALGTAYVKKGVWAQAVDQLRSATGDMRPRVRDGAWASLIDAHRTAGRLRDARDLMPASEPPGFRRLEAAGWVHAELGHYGKALACFEEARRARIVSSGMPKRLGESSRRLEKKCPSTPPLDCPYTASGVGRPWTSGSGSWRSSASEKRYGCNRNMRPHIGG